MIRPASLGLLTALALARPAVASAGPERPIATQAVQAHAAPTTAATADVSRYAQREREHPQVANYEGGNVVVISLSGGALIVLLLILLLI